MAARLQSPQQQSEIVRLRDTVEKQHRQLRLLRDEAAIPTDDVVAASFPATCDKPRLTAAAVSRLLDTASERLSIMDTTLGTTLLATWPERRPVIPVLRPSPGLAAYALRNVPNLPNVVFALFLRPAGEARAAIERTLAEQQAGEPFIPVFLTNDSDFSALREQRLTFEYFPFTVDESAPAPEPRWAAYLQVTLELSMRRWGVRQVVLL